MPRRGLRISGTGFQSLSVERRIWIPVVSGIADSKAQEFPIPQAKFFRIQDSTFK